MTLEGVLKVSRVVGEELKPAGYGEASDWIADGWAIVGGPDDEVSTDFWREIEAVLDGFGAFTGEYYIYFDDSTRNLGIRVPPGFVLEGLDVPDAIENCACPLTTDDLATITAKNPARLAELPSFRRSAAVMRRT